MARRLALALILALCGLLFPDLAHATTGGPETLEILGYDPNDDKVFFKRDFHDEGDERPRVEYIAFKGKAAGKLVVVKSWKREEFETRLEDLRKRLMPLEFLPLADFLLEKRTLKKIQHLQPHFDPRPGLLLSVVVKGKKQRGQRSVKSYANPKNPVELVAVVRIPKRGSVALIRYIGIPYEFGYAVDMPVVLR
jgi:hypothetical protein